MAKSTFKALSLALSIMLTASVFAGCNRDKQEPASSDTETSSQTTPGTDGTKTDTSKPTFDLGGYEMVVAAWWDGTPKPGNESGDAAAERHQEVEKKYNVKIKYENIPQADILAKLAETALAGEPLADFVALEINQAIPGFAAAGIIQPLNQYFDDFKDPKYKENLKTLMSYNGKIYGYQSRVFSTHGIWYNKTLFKRDSLPDLYELQEKGEWTWDKYLEIATKATKDTDGDGTVDQHGIVVGYPIDDHLIWSNGGRIVKEDQGKYTFVADMPETLEALDLIGKINAANVVGPGSEAQFVAGKAAMYGGEAWMGQGFQDNMTDEFGYVFYPKGPKAKEYTSVVTNTNVFCMPASAKHPKETAQIMDEISLWDRAEIERNDFFEGQFTTEEDAKTGLKMNDIFELNNMDAFTDLNKVFYAIVDEVKKGTSASTAVQKYKDQAQAKIDEAMKNAKQ